MEDDLADFDTHLCLACSQSIVGLMNYVTHKQSQCQKRRTGIQPQQQQQQHDQGAYTNSHQVFGQSFNSRGVSGQHQTRTQNDLLGEMSHSYGLRSQDNVMLSSLQRPGNYGRSGGSYSHHQVGQNPSGLVYSSAQSSGGPHSSSTGLSVDVNSPLASFIDSAFSPGEDSHIDPNSVLRSSEPPRSRPDFFQSLELKSITGRETRGTGSEGRGMRSRKRGLQEDALDLDLPITMILSNLDFSSDDEENGVVGFPSDDEDSHVSDSELEWSSPPKTHTGGKWKPGQGPNKKYHPHGPVGGKWKPGQGPQETKAKKGSRSENVKYTKPFFCNLCKAAFPNRFTYNRHFENKTHKDAVEASRTGSTGKKEQQSEEDLEMVIALDPTTGEFRQTTAEPECDSASQNSITSSQCKKRNFCGPFCQTCNLYFDSIRVYDIHCETKKHKENMEKLNRDLQKALLSPDDNADTSNITSAHATGADGDKEAGITDPQTTGESNTKQPEAHFCVVCKKTFKRKYEMARHLLTHFHKQRAMKHPRALEMLDKYNKYVIRLCPFQCNVCQFYFNRASDLLDHLQTPGHGLSCDDLVGPLLCVTCKYKTYSSDTMLQHVQSQAHRQAVAINHNVCIIKECHSKITCKYCGVQMHSAVRMKRHIDCRHPNRKVQEELQVRKGLPNRLNCPDCKKHFRNRSALLRHYQGHQNDRPFRCDVCKKSFTELRRLENHLATSFHQRRVSLVGQRSEVIEVSEDEAEVEKTEQVEETPMGVMDHSENSVTSDSNQLRRSGRPRKPKDFGDMFERESVSQSKKLELKTEDIPEDLTTTAECVEDKTDADQCQEDLLLTVDEEETAAIKPDIFEDNEDSADSNVGEHEETVADSVGADDDCDDAAANSDKDPAFVVQTKAKCKGTGLFTCEHCDFCGDEMEDLKNHYMSEHPKHLITCEPCDQFFLSQKAYRIHCAGGNHQGRLKKVGPSKLELKTCPHCDKKFSDDETYELHVEFVHLHISTEEAVQRVCQGRDMVTQLYGEHLRQLNSISHDSSVSCPECGRFIMKNNLVEHLRVHTGERPFKCRHCSRDFGSRISLRRHLIEHIGKNVHKCETCGKVFKKRGAYTFHQRLHASERKGLKFDCGVCGASFLLESQLVQHKKRHGDRKFKCMVPGCNWAFVLKSELTHHMVTHTGEKTFLCDICGWAAPNTTRLRRHAKTHQPPKVLPCEYCPYKAGCKTHLKRHMRIHIGAKPFKCLYCSYACNTHENMRKHILKTRKHQGLKIYPCKFCKYQSNDAKDFKSHLMVDHLDYVKAKPSESLVKFTGLYHPEEDITKPPEGSEIHQVMKGRFIKVYDGTRVGSTGDPVGPPSSNVGSRKRKPRQNKQQAEQKKVGDEQGTTPKTSSSSEQIAVKVSASDPQLTVSSSDEQVTVKISLSDDQIAMAQDLVDSNGAPISLVTETQQVDQDQQTLTFPPTETSVVYPRGLPWTVVAQENRGGTWCQSMDVVVPQSLGYLPDEPVQVVTDTNTGTAYVRGAVGELPTILTMVNVDSHTFQQIQASGYQVIATGGTTITHSQC